jgi:serine/threonine protein phosphatase PrpC
MGDVIAEELGVSADPEIIHRKLHSGDRYIIIASDGVFEFLTNQVRQHTPLLFTYEMKCNCLSVNEK